MMNWRVISMVHMLILVAVSSSVNAQDPLSVEIVHFYDDECWSKHLKEQSGRQIHAFLFDHFPGMSEPISFRDYDMLCRRELEQQMGRRLYIPYELGAIGFRLESAEALEHQRIPFKAALRLGDGTTFDSFAIDVMGDTINLIPLMRKIEAQEIIMDDSKGFITGELPGLPQGEYVFVMPGAQRYENKEGEKKIIEPVFTQRLKVLDQRR